MLHLRPECERCRRALAPNGGDARICTYECTFCTPCAEELDHLCPNCGGELVARPRPAHPDAALVDANDAISALDRSAHGFREAFRARRLSLTVAVWPAGGEDHQRPHAEDEVYLVLRGRGRIAAGDADFAVRPGSAVYVAAGVDHRFHSIEEDLETVVFWSPPRSRDVGPGAGGP